MYKKKKAIGHLEMITSFLIFGGFLFFLLFYLNPLKHQSISNVILDAVKAGIDDNATLYMVKVPLTVSATGSCFQVPIDEVFSNTDPKKFLVQTNIGDTVPFTITEPSGKHYMNIENKNGIEIYYVYSSAEDLSSPFPPLPACSPPGKYSFTNPLVYTPYSEAKLNYLQQKYKIDYNGLKDQFKIPRAYDFVVNITDISTKQAIVEMKVSKPANIEIRATEIPVEVWTNNNIVNAIMNIQAW
ncbi:hypothetical protein HZA33_03420 [Candidatus Pacearchaeota archaeon]|nr:hypothetical protein [Candidatus Pacearchaeota archaeon]